MADVNRFSEGMIDLAERFADVVDSAQGKGARKGNHGARWLLLPAAGAAVYALATSSSGVARKTRGLMSRARDRATELPDTELLGRVKEATGTAETTTRSGSSSRSTASSRSRNGRTRSRTRRTSSRRTASSR